MGQRALPVRNTSLYVMYKEALSRTRLQHVIELLLHQHLHAMQANRQQAMTLDVMHVMTASDEIGFQL
jgi:hypothetical protein